MLDIQEECEPVDAVKTPAARAMVEENHSGLTITMVLSDMVNGPSYDLRLDFGRVIAYSVYEELVHPWAFIEPALRLDKPWDMYLYPLLKIKNSRWIASLPDLLTLQPGCIHYRLLTLDQIVDVLSKQAPRMSWVDLKKSETFKGAGHPDH